MKPIYFPHTYISKKMAKIMNALFGQVSVLQPSLSSLPEVMKNPSDKELIHIFQPVSGNDDRPSQIISAYNEWGKLHQGKGLSFFKTQIGQIPNYDPTSATRIRADLDRSLNKKVLPEKGDENTILSGEGFLWWARDF